MKKLLKMALLAVTATCLFSCDLPSQGSSESQPQSGSSESQPQSGSENSSEVVSSNEETKTTWTVEFLLNNDTDEVYKTIEVENNKTIESITDPTRNGYTFDGWYVDPACTVYFDEIGEKITSNMKVYAKWVSSGITNPDTGGENSSEDPGTSEDSGDEFVLPSGATVDAPTSGYALYITTANGENYYFPLTPGEEFEGFAQHVGLGLTFNEGDLITLFDGTNNAHWAEDNLNPYSISGCFVASTEGITCQTTGSYDVYAKFKFEADEVYIGGAAA